ncbi:ABC transporter substrate-binding protein [Pseudoroseicyclus aestuarii]|uniref:Peptide/nickel transport system substrate-binding protein n=1 Tax=Pseudoroseicyclus aestuarii TaxID=1795041 RepID=A0A318SWW6_9RHOB|nr:ABC transporter substrate-binding protein [Pseudoroseicyclus aestuarii]PYE84889.1 peptide/nickel transport system substrate-binding protein [Pseudoroseicyclus aestuarii]
MTRHQPLLIPAAILALSLPAALPALAQEQGTVRIGEMQEPTVLDPTVDATASIDEMLTQNLYESLTTVNEAGEVLPQLAESWEISDDGLTYTFTLTQDAAFHDGTPFDAEAVRFSFERAMAEGSTNPSSDIWEPIESVTVTDPRTIEVTLSRPDAFFLFNLAQGDASIVSPASAETNVTEPVGTGPFRFVSWTRGDRLVLEKNPDHRDAGEVTIPGVEFRFITDASAMAAALLAGELDRAGLGAPELLAQFENDDRFTVEIGTTEGEVILALNNGRAPFDDIRAREAVNRAIDREEIIAGAMDGTATPIGSFYPPHGPAYVDLTGTWPHDTETAAALFQEVGVTELSLTVPPFPYATRSAEIIQAELAQAGVAVSVETVEWGYWLEEVYSNRNYDMTIIAHTSPNDMGNFARGPEYFYGFQSDEFDALWDRISAETDAEARNALLEEGQRYLAENAVMAFLFQLPELAVQRSDLEGFWTAAPVLYQPLKEVHWAE